MHCNAHQHVRNYEAAVDTLRRAAPPALTTHTTHITHTLHNTRNMPPAAPPSPPRARAHLRAHALAPPASIICKRSCFCPRVRGGRVDVCRVLPRAGRKHATAERRLFSFSSMPSQVRFLFISPSLSPQSSSFSSSSSSSPVHLFLLCAFPYVWLPLFFLLASSLVSGSYLFVPVLPRHLNSPLCSLSRLPLHALHRAFPAFTLFPRSFTIFYDRSQ